MITLGAACGPRPPPPADALAGRVLPGIDVLLAGDPGPLAGRRIGLITNQTGVTADGASTIDALHAHPGLQLVALFSPEHGIRGIAEAGETIASGVDPRTGLPIHSLYGETRRPTAAMLSGVDALVFDIQDIGTRYYTYIWTMALAMETAAEAGLPFVVLDRPNPLGGRLMQGNVLDPAFATFVGLHPVPMRHGLTVGEMARYLNFEQAIGAQLTVVPVQGWGRAAWYDETGLPWIAPSPNMPDLESATHYPGTCLFEGTNLSVGRGTAAPFQQIGAPWLDATALADRLNRIGLPGVRFEPGRFTPRSPGDGKYADIEVSSLRWVTTDRERHDPTRAAVAALVEIRRLHGDSLTFRADHFDRLAGTDALRRGLLNGEDAAALTAGWNDARAAFASRAARHLLYR